jgi:hypothetical protein
MKYIKLCQEELLGFVESDYCSQQKCPFILWFEAAEDLNCKCHQTRDIHMSGVCLLFGFVLFETLF